MTDSQIQSGLGPSKENLKQRYELFQLMQKSHVRWMQETNDLTIRAMHGTLASLFTILMDQYEALLGKLAKDANTKK